MTEHERCKEVVDSYKRCLKDELFADRFLNWLFYQGYIEEFENLLRSDQNEIIKQWHEEKRKLEAQGAGDAAEAAWERVNR